MQSLYQSKFSCISKSKINEDLKKIYQKKLLEIFQNERKYINFIIAPYEYRDPQHNTVKSTIHFYKRTKYIPLEPKPNETDEEKKKRKEEDEKRKKNDPEEIKKSFCSLNKNEQFQNISFIDQIGNFFEKTLYFIKYISHANANIANNTGYDTKIVEIARCGFNMGEILLNMGYKELNHYASTGYFYQYKYYPIICFYARFNGEEHIFLQINGYYTENTKKEIIEELDKIKEQLNELFYIK